MGSIPTGGNCQAGRYKRSNYFTDMAQRQRAGLITPRSLDRNGLSVFHKIDLNIYGLYQ